MSWPKPVITPPDEEELMEMLEDAVMDNETHFETSDGCTTDQDGTCCHGHATWLVRFGLI